MLTSMFDLSCVDLEGRGFPGRFEVEINGPRKWPPLIQSPWHLSDSLLPRAVKPRAQLPSDLAWMSASVSIDTLLATPGRSHVSVDTNCFNGVMRACHGTVGSQCVPKKDYGKGILHLSSRK